MSALNLSATAPPQVAALIELAEHQHAGGRLAAARVSYVRAVTLDVTGAARLQFAAFLSQLGRFDEAAAHLELLRRTAAARGDRHLAAAAAQNLASVLRASGRTVAAASWQQQAVAAEADGPHTPETPHAPETLAGLANDAILRGELSLAHDLVTRSLAWEVRRGNLSGQADDRGTLGVIRGLQGDLDGATACLVQAYRGHVRLREWHGAATDLLNLAEMSARGGRWRRAAAICRKAKRLARHIGAADLARRAAVRLRDAGRVLSALERDPRLN